MATTVPSERPLNDRDAPDQTEADSSTTPYWNVNIPSHLHTTTCPPYLLNLSQKDYTHLLIPDVSYTRLTWPTIRTLVHSNNLQSFTRLPSDLRRYRKFVYDVTQKYGSVERFMLEERLGWSAAELEEGRRRKPFERAEDVKVLKNDWPYGLQEGIEHLVVWTRFGLGGDEEGEEAGKVAIEGFMERNFFAHVPRDNVVWFRNWGALKSVDAVEHFHVMLLDASPGFIQSITTKPCI